MVSDFPGCNASVHAEDSQRNLADRGRRSDFRKPLAHSDGAAFYFLWSCQVDNSRSAEFHFLSLVPLGQTKILRLVFKGDCWK